MILPFDHIASITAEEIEHRINIDDLGNEIQEMYNDGEGRLGQSQLEKLVDYIVMELTLPLCVVCGFQIYPKAYFEMHKKCNAELADKRLFQAQQEERTS